MATALSFEPRGQASAEYVDWVNTDLQATTLSTQIPNVELPVISYAMYEAVRLTSLGHLALHIGTEKQVTRNLIPTLLIQCRQRMNAVNNEHLVSLTISKGILAIEIGQQLEPGYATEPEENDILRAIADGQYTETYAPAALLRKVSAFNKAHAVRRGYELGLLSV